MPNRATKPVTITLSPLTEMAQGRVASGLNASVSKVVRAGLGALEREDAVEILPIAHAGRDLDRMFKGNDPLEM